MLLKSYFNGPYLLKPPCRDKFELSCYPIIAMNLITTKLQLRLSFCWTNRPLYWCIIFKFRISCRKKTDWGTTQLLFTLPGNVTLIPITFPLTTFCHFLSAISCGAWIHTLKFSIMSLSFYHSAITASFSLINSILNQLESYLSLTLMYHIL